MQRRRSHTVSILLGTGAKTALPDDPFHLGFIRLSRVLWLSVLVVMLGGLLEPEAAAQTVLFGAKTDFGTGARSRSVAVGDFNGDGTLDLAVANENSSQAGFGNDSATVSILLGTGTGSFGAKTDFGTGRASEVLVGDFNGDGKLDLAVAGGILLGTGTGSFGAKTDFGTDFVPASVAVGDFNGDGNLDLATANGDPSGFFSDTDPQTVSILLGTGTGSFGAKTNFGTGSSPQSVAVGDFNGDGKLDLAVANFDSNTGSILLGTGTGSFGPKTDFGTGAGPVSVAVGDFNGDGNLDLAVANLGSIFVNDPGPATVSILLNTGPTGPTGPIDDPQFFVRQHYRDFLNRQADDLGLAFWTNEITSCGSDPQCIEAKRINVSAAFFLSIEFQQTGYLVYRFYKGAYGNLPGAPVPLRFSEFLPDTQKIGQGVIVNQAGWETVLENNKQAFAAEFVQRSRFTSAYPTSLTPEQFVDQLFMNAGVTPSATDRAAAINEFGSAANTADIAARARTLRRVAEDSTLAQQEFNRAFVLMQYFGYLRRNPNDAPDLNFAGYDFWLTKLNQFAGNFINAEMVKAFISSTEYRQRFGAN